MDVPNHRSSHTTPVPRGGGLACLVGVSAALLVPPRSVPARALVALVTLSGIGFVDDRLGGVDPRIRLAAQATVGLACGARHSLAVAVAGAVVVPGVVNVVNFMDGINGISGLTAGTWGAFTALDHEFAEPIKLIGAATAGAGVGFLPFNVPTASLFLGDIGSYLLGTLMSVAIIEALPQPGRALRLGAPLLPYAADATQALIVRAGRGEPLLEAHRQHVYQRFVDEQCWSHSRMATTHSLVAVAVGFAARAKNPYVAAAYCTTLSAAYAASPHLARHLREKGDA